MNPCWKLGLLGAFLFAALGLEAQKLPPSAPARFEFREPHLRGYTLEPRPAALQAAPGHASNESWLIAHPDHDPGQTVEIGRRLFVKMQPGKNINDVLQNSALQLAKALNETCFVLQAPDAMAALQEAQRIGNSPDVVVCVPIMRRELALQSSYAPNDPYLASQWNLSARDTNGTPFGADLNIRPAWNITRGEGVTIGVADDGVELTHPELVARGAGSPHFNFHLGTTNGEPVSSVVSLDGKKAFGHGTAVAGMAVASGNNGVGIVGVAPEAKLASWVIFTTNSVGNRIAVDDEQRMEMFQFNIDAVPVQNHSWGNEGAAQNPMSAIEDVGIQNAIANGRGGRGVVMVRGAGNFRYLHSGSTYILANANDDGYPADRRAIAVAGVNSTGRATRYSNPGACLLVAAPATEWLGEVAGATDLSPDLSLPSLFMVDRQGALGFNTATNELSDYCFSNTVQPGTSFATPQVAGLAALLLSLNTNFSYRDVQQILVLSSRHMDWADPDLNTNGAGLFVSHNVGFGIPDAAAAVRLAQIWALRPALVSISFTNETPAIVPDDGLRVIVSNAPPELQTIAASPTTGKHIDEPTILRPIVDVGQVTTNIPVDLTGKIALIQRGGATFAAKIHFAAQAGAIGAIIYNNISTTERLPYALSLTTPKLTLPMVDTDYVPIPAVFINRQNGEALRDFVATNAAHVQFHLLTTNYSFAVTNQLLCEHIEVRVDGDNTDATGSTNARRGDIRITLLSPTGTRSILQRLNTDTNKLTSPAWTYQTTHDFFENSAGTWTVSISDESPGATAVIRSVALRIYGTEIAHAPASVPGKIFTFSINSGSGNYAANGSYSFMASTTGNYQIQPRSGDIAPHTGSYTTSLIGTVMQQITTDQEVFQLTYISASQGSFVARNSSNSSFLQTGTFTVLPTGPDLNSDGQPDLLFQENSGRLAAWLMDGTNFLHATLLTGNQPSPAWRNVGWADFNADEKRDVFLQNDHGQLAVGQMNGTNLLGFQLLHGGFGPLSGWKAVSAQDFDGDGKVDFLFQHSRGQLAVWLMNGANLSHAVWLREGQPVAPGWQAFGTGDFNGDLHPDILFQHTNGRLAVWHMNGTSFLDADFLRDGLPIRTGWRAAGIADTDGDGLNDILFQSQNNHAVIVWHMSGKNFLHHSFLKTGSPDWQLVSPK